MTNGNRHARRAWASALKRNVRPGAVLFVEIRHDADCGIYTPACACTCSPDRVLKNHTGRVLAEVAGAGFFDPLEFAGAV